MSDPQLPPPGWYEHSGAPRWWDGSQWGPVSPPTGTPVPPVGHTPRTSRTAGVAPIAWVGFAFGIAAVLSLLPDLGRGTWILGMLGSWTVIPAIVCSIIGLVKSEQKLIPIIGLVGAGLATVLPALTWYW